MGIMILLGASGAIAYRVRIVKAKARTKHLMSKFDDNDPAWRYDDIQKQVEKAYHKIQEAWGANNLMIAKAFLSDDLYEKFQTKLEWMSYQNRKNVMDKIRLDSAKPVMVHNEEGSANDYVWYHIDGSMVDYIIDEKTGEQISGSKDRCSFVEYWMFVRKNRSWVLNKILQKEEGKALLDDVSRATKN